MPSARRTGANEQVTSYGNGTRTYTTLQAWELATDTDHVSDNESDVLECFDDATSFDDHDDIDGSTNDATRFRIIRAASGEGHDGTSNNGVYFADTSAAAGDTNINETFSQVQDLIFNYQANDAGGEFTLVLTAADTKAIACIIFDSNNAGAGGMSGIRLVGDDSIAVLCLIENIEDTNFNSATGATVRFYSCTSVDAGTNSYRNAATVVVVKNCIASNAGSDDFEAGTYTGSINNAASDATDPDTGAGNLTDVGFRFVDAGSNDYHLDNTDPGALRGGADLSGDGTFAFDDDIDGDTIGRWPIGFDWIQQTSRVQGANEQIATYGNGTRTYSDLGTWEIATDTDHVADAETDVLECFDDSSSFNDDVKCDGSANNATYFRIIRPASGEGHDGTTNNGVYFNSTSGETICHGLETFVQFQDLILTQTINLGFQQRAALSGSADVKFIGILVFDSANSGSETCDGFMLDRANGSVAVLCLVHNVDSHGFIGRSNSAEMSVFSNCISQGNAGDGWQTALSSPLAICKNCLSDGNTGTDFAAGTYTGSINNAASDTSDPDSGAGNRTEQNFAFVSEVGDDFHLTTEDGGAKDFGTSLLDDLTFSFDDDIDGDLFNVWDIGFDEPGDVTSLLNWNPQDLDPISAHRDISIIGH